MTTVWHEASRIAAWAPDTARELVTAIIPEQPFDDARAAELLGRIFAVTGAWQVARAAFREAADAWEPGDAARAVAVRGVGDQFPLAPFSDDADAVAAELDVVRRALDPSAPPPVVRRTVVELRRALPPVRVTGQLEANLGLSPAELALVLAAAAAVLDPEIPALTAVAWESLIAASMLGPSSHVTRLVRLGAIAETPELVAAPAIASWLAGRRTLEQTPGVRLRRLPAAPPPAVLRDARALVLDGASVVVEDPEVLAGELAVAGRALFELVVSPEAPRSSIVAASLEARLHGGFPLIDRDAIDDQLAGELAPIAVFGGIVGR